MAEANLQGCAKDLFTLVDNDKSGTISKGELRRVLMSFPGIKLSESDFNTTFKQADADDSGEVDTKEFPALLVTLCKESGLDIAELHERVKTEMQKRGSVLTRSRSVFEPNMPGGKSNRPIFNDEGELVVEESTEPAPVAAPTPDPPQPVSPPSPPKGPSPPPSPSKSKETPQGEGDGKKGVQFRSDGPSGSGEPPGGGGTQQVAGNENSPPQEDEEERKKRVSLRRVGRKIITGIRFGNMAKEFAAQKSTEGPEQLREKIKNLEHRLGQAAVKMAELQSKNMKLSKEAEMVSVEKMAVESMKEELRGERIRLRRARRRSNMSEATSGGEMAANRGIAAQERSEGPPGPWDHPAYRLRLKLRVADLLAQYSRQGISKDPSVVEKEAAEFVIKEIQEQESRAADNQPAELPKTESASNLLFEEFLSSPSPPTGEDPPVVDLLIQPDPKDRERIGELEGLNKSLQAELDQQNQRVEQLEHSGDRNARLELEVLKGKLQEMQGAHQAQLRAERNKLAQFEKTAQQNNLDASLKMMELRAANKNCPMCKHNEQRACVMEDNIERLEETYEEVLHGTRMRIGELEEMYMGAMHDLDLCASKTMLMDELVDLRNYKNTHERMQVRCRRCESYAKQNEGQRLKIAELMKTIRAYESDISKDRQLNQLTRERNHLTDELQVTQERLGDLEYEREKKMHQKCKRCDTLEKQTTALQLQLERVTTMRKEGERAELAYHRDQVDSLNERLLELLRQRGEAQTRIEEQEGEKSTLMLEVVQQKARAEAGEKRVKKLNSILQLYTSLADELNQGSEGNVCIHPGYGSDLMEGGKVGGEQLEKKQQAGNDEPAGTPSAILGDGGLVEEMGTGTPPRGPGGEEGSSGGGRGLGGGKDVELEARYIAEGDKEGQNFIQMKRAVAGVMERVRTAKEREEKSRQEAEDARLLAEEERLKRREVVANAAVSLSPSMRALASSTAIGSHLEPPLSGRSSLAATPRSNTSTNTGARGNNSTKHSVDLLGRSGGDDEGPEVLTVAEIKSRIASAPTRRQRAQMAQGTRQAHGSPLTDNKGKGGPGRYFDYNTRQWKNAQDGGSITRVSSTHSISNTSARCTGGAHRPGEAKASTSSRPAALAHSTTLPTALHTHYATQIPGSARQGSSSNGSHTNGQG